MLGDRVVPMPYHTSAAREVFAILRRTDDRTVITIAGESGAGKSEIAAELGRFFTEAGTPNFVFQQDDYFFYPPKTNADRRKKDISHVGLTEVNMRLLDGHLAHFKQSPAKPLSKPLIIFEEDRITQETIDLSNFKIAIAEGTYTTLLNNVDFRVFIDRSFQDTLDHRKRRKRDTLDEYSNRILTIEHGIISKHKTLADIIVDKDYSVRRVEEE